MHFIISFSEDVWELSLSPVLLILFAVIGGIVLVAFSIILYLKFQGRRNIAKGSVYYYYYCCFLAPSFLCQTSSSRQKFNFPIDTRYHDGEKQALCASTENFPRLY